MGKVEVVKSSAKTCDDTLDAMESDKTKITCLADCAEEEDKIKKVGADGFTMDSPPCIAAKIYYKGKDE